MSCPVSLNDFQHVRVTGYGLPWLQYSKFLKTLDAMEAKMAGQAHRVQGDRAVAGFLRRQEIVGRRGVHGIEDAAEVFYSDSASIGLGAFVVRTIAGSNASGRTRCDQYAYVPFMSGRRHNPCVLEVDQIVLVRKPGMGWPNDEARLAVGCLYDHLQVRKGCGLEDKFNDDPARGACVVPRALFLSADRKKHGYKWAVHLNQVYCSCCVITGPSGDTFVTSHKMGYHGRKDLQFSDEY